MWLRHLRRRFRQSGRYGLDDLEPEGPTEPKDERCAGLDQREDEDHGQGPRDLGPDDRPDDLPPDLPASGAGEPRGVFSERVDPRQS